MKAVYTLIGLLAILAAVGCGSVRSVPVDMRGLSAVADNPPIPDVSCLKWQGYVPDTLHPELMPVRTIRVNFHIMDSKDSSKNFPQEEGRAFVLGLLEVANEKLASNERNWRSPEGTAILPKGYRYELTPQPVKGDDGIYFHYDDELWYFVSQGKNQNNYKREVIQKYNVGGDSILNIFLQVHPEDSIKSARYRANGQGIALGTSLKMGGIYELGQTPASAVGLFNHEVGHILGLSHAWGNDGCTDTDPHPNRCWDWTPDPPCNEDATNNMMDYNAHQFALTPCQIAKVHYSLSNERGPVRKCLKLDYCNIIEGNDVVIQDSVSWIGAKDLTGNITIEPEGILVLNCRVSMPAGSQILVKPGGRLWLNGTHLHNACGLQWKGIVVETKGKQSGEVLLSRASKIEHVAESPQTEP